MQVTPQLEAALNALAFKDLTPLHLELQWMGRSDDAKLVKAVVEAWLKGGKLRVEKGRMEK